MLLAHKSRCVALAASLGIGHATAAPVEGEVGSNLASLLVLLGVWALLWVCAACVNSGTSA